MTVSASDRGSQAIDNGNGSNQSVDLGISGNSTPTLAHKRQNTGLGEHTSHDTPVQRRRRTHTMYAHQDERGSNDAIDMPITHVLPSEMLGARIAKTISIIVSIAKDSIIESETTILP
eukprot:jgi/Hompol1/5219/HPOL_000697-RA